MKTILIVLAICFTSVPALASRNANIDRENPSMYGGNDTVTTGNSIDCLPCVYGSKYNYAAALKDHADQADADRVREEAQLQNTTGKDEVK